MSEYILSFKPAVGLYGYHDPSAVLFENGELLFATEEERHTRQKHAPGTFPTNSIQACLNHAEISLEDVDRIILPYDPSLQKKRLSHDLRSTIESGQHLAVRGWRLISRLKAAIQHWKFPDREVVRNLEEFGADIPRIEHKAHHYCHAASAFYPTSFDDALVLTLDGRGEFDSSVIWRGSRDGLKRLRTYEHPNSLGHFYGAVTEYLGYRAFNGEGKIMGLAPYGERDPEIESKLRAIADFGVGYDVTNITCQGVETGAQFLAELFERPLATNKDGFNDFDKNLAHTTQILLEETVTQMVEKFVEKTDVHSVCLAGGVALNCKMNKRIMELDSVDDLFVQPVANDAGLALGAGWSEVKPEDVTPMNNVYWGPSSSNESVRELLETNKIPHEQKNDVEKYVAASLAEGALVAWVQGRQEMGPRALGNRSILADPRTIESRDRVNKYVKHREEWRPFAPSMLEEDAERYLKKSEPSPYMIKTFDTDSRYRDEIQAVIHPGDGTTRPQTVNREQNPRYYALIEEFAEITGVPVLLNTSFNDHGEPVVTTPKEAIQDFYGMGLDILVIDDYVVKKPSAE